MRKLLLMSILLGVSSLGFSKTFFQVYLNDASLANLREKPSSSSRILAGLDMFEEGELIRREGNWYYIKYRTESGKMLYGYIHKSQGYLMETYVVSSKDGYANIRWEPSSSAKIAGKEKNGKVLEVYEEKGDWLYIT